MYERFPCLSIAGSDGETGLLLPKIAVCCLVVSGSELDYLCINMICLIGHTATMVHDGLAFFTLSLHIVIRFYR